MLFSVWLNMSKMKMGDESICEADGKCVVKLNSYGWKSIKKNALFILRLDTSLHIVGEFILDGYSLIFEDL